MSDRGVAVVTGGASGIGAATTRQLLDDGWRVAVWSRNEERNEELRRSLPDAPLVVCHSDVSSAADTEAAMARTVAEIGYPTALVCAAGSAPRTRSFALQTDLGAWRGEVAGAVDAVALPVWEVVRALRAEGREGSVVVVGSLAAVSGQPLGDAYAAGKGAALAFVRSLACQLGRHSVRVNAILPGWIDTPMIQPLMRRDDSAKRISERIPLGRLGRPAEVAAAIVFLLGEDSTYVTGQTLVIDGGYSIS